MGLLNRLYLASLMGLILYVPSILCAGPIETLLVLPYRPSVQEILDASIENQGRLLESSNPFSKREASAKLPLDGINKSIILSLPGLIAGIEKGFAGATWAPVGRDAAFLGDLIDGFYKSIGQNRIERVNISNYSITGESDLEEFFRGGPLAKGPVLDPNATEFYPLVMLDQTRFQPGSQSTRYLKAWTRLLQERHISPLNGVERINFINTGAEKGMYNQNVLTKNFDLSRFVERQSRENLNYADILSVRVSNDLTYTEEYHNTFQKLSRNQEGIMVAAPGKMSSDALRIKILAQTFDGLKIVAHPLFLHLVQLESRYLGYEFPLERVSSIAERRAIRSARPINEIVGTSADQYLRERIKIYFQLGLKAADLLPSLENEVGKSPDLKGKNPALLALQTLVELSRGDFFEYLESLQQVLVKITGPLSLDEVSYQKLKALLEQVNKQAEVPALLSALQDQWTNAKISGASKSYLSNFFLLSEAVNSGVTFSDFQKNQYRLITRKVTKEFHQNRLRDGLGRSSEVQALLAQAQTSAQSLGDGQYIVALKLALDAYVNHQIERDVLLEYLLPFFDTNSKKYIPLDESQNRSEFVTTIQRSSILMQLFPALVVNRLFADLWRKSNDPVVWIKAQRPFMLRMAALYKSIFQVEDQSFTNLHVEKVIQGLLSTESGWEKLGDFISSLDTHLVIDYWRAAFHVLDAMVQKGEVPKTWVAEFTLQSLIKIRTDGVVYQTHISKLFNETPLYQDIWFNDLPMLIAGSKGRPTLIPVYDRLTQKMFETKKFPSLTTSVVEKTKNRLLKQIEDGDVSNYEAFRVAWSKVNSELHPIAERELPLLKLEVLVKAYESRLIAQDQFEKEVSIFILSLADRSLLERSFDQKLVSLWSPHPQTKKVFLSAALNVFKNADTALMQKANGGISGSYLYWKNLTWIWDLCGGNRTTSLDAQFVDANLDVLLRRKWFPDASDKKAKNESHTLQWISATMVPRLAKFSLKNPGDGQSLLDQIILSLFAKAPKDLTARDLLRKIYSELLNKQIEFEVSVQKGAQFTLNPREQEEHDLTLKYMRAYSELFTKVGQHPTFSEQLLSKLKEKRALEGANSDIANRYLEATAKFVSRSGQYSERETKQSLMDDLVAEVVKLTKIELLYNLKFDSLDVLSLLLNSFETVHARASIDGEMFSAIFNFVLARTGFASEFFGSDVSLKVKIKTLVELFKSHKGLWKDLDLAINKNSLARYTEQSVLKLSFSQLELLQEFYAQDEVPPNIKELFETETRSAARTIYIQLWKDVAQSKLAVGLVVNGLVAFLETFERTRHPELSSFNLMEQNLRMMLSWRPQEVMSLSLKEAIIARCLKLNGFDRSQLEQSLRASVAMKSIFMEDPYAILKEGIAGPNAEMTSFSKEVVQFLVELKIEERHPRSSAEFFEFLRSQLQTQATVDTKRLNLDLILKMSKTYLRHLTTGSNEEQSSFIWSYVNGLSEAMDRNQIPRFEKQGMSADNGAALNKAFEFAIENAPVHDEPLAAKLRKLLDSNEYFQRGWQEFKRANKQNGTIVSKMQQLEYTGLGFCRMSLRKITGR